MNNKIEIERWHLEDLLEDAICQLRVNRIYLDAGSPVIVAQVDLIARTTALLGNSDNGANK